MAGGNTIGEPPYIAADVTSYGKTNKYVKRLEFAVLV